jgi:biopolymer transport protein ExbD
MAGTQNIGESSDNPVAINVTAMVDVIFCLCIFFMCSFHFKQLEGKIETWLPKDLSINPSQVDKSLLEDIRVFLRWDPQNSMTVRWVGNNPPVPSDQKLRETILDLGKVHIAAGKKDYPVLLDSGRDVPWQDVIHVMDMLKREGIDKIEFAGGGG